MKDTKTTDIYCIYKVFTFASIILMTIWVIFDIFFAHHLAPNLPLLGKKFYEPSYTRNFKTDEILDVIIVVWTVTWTVIIFFSEHVKDRTFGIHFREILKKSGDSEIFFNFMSVIRFVEMILLIAASFLDWYIFTLHMAVWQIIDLGLTYYFIITIFSDDNLLYMIRNNLNNYCKNYLEAKPEELEKIKSGYHDMLFYEMLRSMDYNDAYAFDNMQSILMHSINAINKERFTSPAPGSRKEEYSTLQRLYELFNQFIHTLLKSARDESRRLEILINIYVGNELQGPRSTYIRKFMLLSLLSDTDPKNQYLVDQILPYNGVGEHSITPADSCKLLIWCKTCTDYYESNGITQPYVRAAISNHLENLLNADKSGEIEKIDKDKYETEYTEVIKNLLIRD